MDKDNGNDGVTTTTTTITTAAINHRGSTL